MSTRFRSFRLFLLRWHRRFGVVLSLALLWLAVTGIALNHAGDWGLDQAPGPAFLQGFYRDQGLVFTSYRAGGQWLSHNGASTLYLGATEVGFCARPFAGAVELNGEIIAACGGTLLLLTPQGQLLERVDVAYEIPATVEAVGVAGAELVLHTRGADYRADLDSLRFPRLPAAETEPAWALPGRPDSALQARLEALSYGAGASWTQVMLDLHSGRIFGRAGALAADLLAAGLILLAASGVWVWTTKPGRWRRRR